MGDRLGEYRRRRDARRTPEPVPAGPPPRGRDDTFVIQQHHARSLHWDLRLERDGVLVSWAVPRGIPKDPRRNNLAVHTEDHPLEYADFHGEIPEGEYGGGRMTIYDRGTYTTEKWRDDEVVVVLDGSRVHGRYALFQTDGKNWMIHRMDPPEPGWEPMPDLIPPMRASPARRLPADESAWGYELHWPGVRAVAYVSGGRLRLSSADGHDTGDTNPDRDITATYPDLRPMAESLAPTECVLDGVVVAFDPAGQVSAAALHPRTEVTDSAAARRLATRVPAHYLAFDLLWLDGRPTLDLPYTDRRDLLDDLALTGPRWQTPPYFPATGQAALDTSRAQSLPGIIAKNLTSPYRPGKRTRDWLAIPA